MRIKIIFFPIVFLSLFSLDLFAQSHITFYVSPKGSNKNAGTIEKPFVTPEKALEMVKKIKQTDHYDSTFICFREGVYYRTHPLEITEEIGRKKGTIIFKAFGNEKVVFHGGKKIDGGKFKLCTDRSILNRLLPEIQGKVWVLDLKKAGIIDYGTMKQHGFGKIPEPAPLELFINGELQTLARYPNEGILKIGRVYDKGSIPRNGDFSNRGAEFGYEYDRPTRWSGANDIWLHGKFSYGYNDDHLKVERIDQYKKSLKMLQPHLYGVVSSIYIDSTQSQDLAGLSVRGYYAYNLLEEIDQPGEYYLDRQTGKLYIYPSMPLANAEIEVSLSENPFFNIRNSSNIKIEGINFTCARGLGIYLENAHDITIDHCVFSNLGTVAISMGHVLQHNKAEYSADGSPKQEDKVVGDFKNNVISNCLIYNTGTGGIMIEGGDRKNLTAAHNLVYNTEFYHTDRINNTYSPAVKLNGVGNIIRNCYFHDLKHQSISFMGNDHVIEYCRFDNVCTDADDMGAIYTGRNPSARGTVIQYNYFSNIRPKDKETSMCGVYFDDGSGGMTIRKNFFYKVGNPGHYQSFGAVYFHGGFDIKVMNNIFMDCDVAVGNAPWDGERWKKSLEGPLIKERLRVEVDILGSVYQEKYPELKDYFTNIGRRLNLVRDNLLIRSQTAQSGDLMLRKNITLNEVGSLPVKIDYQEVKKYLPSIEPFPFEKTGLIKIAH